MKKNRFLSRILIISLIFAFLSGCGRRKTEIVLTTDFEPDEVFRIENLSCMKNEVMVYLVNSENSYDELLGPEIWDTEIESKSSIEAAKEKEAKDPSAISVNIENAPQSDAAADASPDQEAAEEDIPSEEAPAKVTVEDRYKETILARLAQIKALKLLAEKRNIKLDPKDDEKIKAAAKFYYNSLNDQEKELMGVTETDIYNMYTDYAIAEKLYHSVADQINPEISDDAARTVSIGSILVKTYRTDSKGNRIDLKGEELEKARERALDIKRQLDEGTEFEVLADSYYNEDDKSEYSFPRGVMPYALEEAAFSLGNGEISDIIKTEYGFHIIKCRSTFNKEETEKNRLAMIEKSKQDAFNSLYSEFVTTLKSNLNEPLWTSISYEKTPDISTKSFFEIYDSYFTVIHDEHAPSTE